MAVFLNNLDDFIAPGQACVNPVFSGPAAAAGTGGATARITLQSDLSTTEFDIKATSLIVEPNLIRTRTVADHKVASVSLNDCLACSGCVTSAETVLIQEQSQDKLLARMAARRGIIVVAISPQSRASLAHSLGMSSLDAFLRCATVLKAHGVAYVADTSSAGDIALLEAREEFMARYRSERCCEGSGSSFSGALWQAPPFTTAVSATRIRRIIPPSLGTQEDVAVVGHVTSQELPRSLPMLVSSCPGWVCFAEKTQPQALSFMSTAKSAQQILGVVVKRLLFPPARVSEAITMGGQSSAAEPPFVVSVQPCFDKKLEASRLDFSHDEWGSGGSVREVDLVLSTAELLQMLHSLLLTQQQQQQSGTSSSVKDLLAAVPPDTPLGCDSTEALLRRFSADGQHLVSAADSNGGSGAFLDYVLRYAAQEVCGVNMWGAHGSPRPLLPWESGRNADMAEVEITGSDSSGGVGVPIEMSEPSACVPGPRKLRCAKVYGFRNVQSLLLKLKRGKCDLDLVEVMACPSGCVNGGGQIKSNAVEGGAVGNETLAEARARILAVEAELHAGVQVERPEDSPLARFLYGPEHTGGAGIGAPLSTRALELFHTRYHAVPKLEMVAPLAAKW